MSNNDKFKELYKAIGVLAETGILFYSGRCNSRRSHDLDPGFYTSFHAR